MITGIYRVVWPCYFSGRSYELGELVEFSRHPHHSAFQLLGVLVVPDKSTWLRDGMPVSDYEDLEALCRRPLPIRAQLAIVRRIRQARPEHERRELQRKIEREARRLRKAAAVAEIVEDLQRDLVEEQEIQQKFYKPSKKELQEGSENGKGKKAVDRHRRQRRQAS